MNAYGFIFIGLTALATSACGMVYVSEGVPRLGTRDMWGGAAAAMALMFWVLMFCPAFYG